LVIFLAGLQGIPQVYHDAARVDGAGPWQRFRRITLPLLRPTILFVLVTGIISSFQVFTYVSVMTEGGPLHATEVVVYRIYQEAWEFLRFGTASAMSLVLLVILLLATWLQFRWLGRKVELV
jgi:ABC-type sugar transport system permease subunit